MYNIRKKKMNILITSASRKVSLIKSFKDALKKEGGGKVIATDFSPFSAALYFSDSFYLTPKDSDPLFIAKLLVFCKKHQIKLIVPTRDEELIIFAENKEKFKKIGTEIMVSSPVTVDICSDKLKFLNFCKENNFDSPKVYQLSDIKNKKTKLPVFLNDRFGKGSKNAFKVKNFDELKAFLKIIKNPIIVDYIDEKEYTIDLFADFDGNVISVVPRERIGVFGGESFIGKTVKNEILMDLAIKIANKLKLIGHNTIQCFFDGKTVKFIEVNPRYGGGASLGFAAGADTPRFLIKILKGDTITSQIGRFKNGLVMMRYAKDFFIRFTN